MAVLQLHFVMEAHNYDILEEEITSSAEPAQKNEHIGRDILLNIISATAVSRLAQRLLLEN